MQIPNSKLQFTVQCLGSIGYREALDLQKQLVEQRMKGDIGDQLLLLEHPPVITQGKRDCADDFLSTPEAIRNDGIDIIRVDRGGRLTYHGPGQLIGYFICDVSRFGGVKKFVTAIEDMLIVVCKDYGIDAHRDPDHPGVWVDEAKVAAVGLHVTRDITSHGFALNVNCDLSPYRHIVACGLNDRSVTTMEAQAHRPIAMDGVVTAVCQRMVTR